MGERKRVRAGPTARTVVWATAVVPFEKPPAYPVGSGPLFLSNANQRKWVTV
jgi:hypothetical protein